MENSVQSEISIETENTTTKEEEVLKPQENINSDLQTNINLELQVNLTSKLKENINADTASEKETSEAKTVVETKQEIDTIIDGSPTQDNVNDDIKTKIEPESLIPAESDVDNPESLDGISNAADPDLDLDDIDQITPEEVNEAYNNIMNVCSSAAQAIKKTIVEVLNSRGDEALVEPQGTTKDLEESLKEKIADFESAVSSCCPIDKTESECPAVKECGTENTIEVKVEKKAPKPEAETVQLTSSDVQPNKQHKEKRESVAIKAESENLEEKTQTAVEDESSQRRQQKSYVNKKKGEKTVDQVLKSLSNCATSEDKLQTLCKKHIEALEDVRTNDMRTKQFERQVITLSREKEQLQADHNRMILAKSRLESLCRELQRQNRAVKEESLTRIREEEEKRKEVANKFQATLTDISGLMQENSKKNISLREENAELAKKLKALVEHYEMWEKHMEKVVQQKDLETQLAKAKHAKTNLMLKQETEKFLREKQTLLENMNELQKKCTMLATNELQLRTELGDYTSKYEEFQSVLNKSSQVFANFKTDMEITSKKIKKLEKETNFYKLKWEGSNNALLNMISDKQKQDKDLVNAQQRILTLEKLCRALQGERNELQNQVNVLSTAAQVQVCEKDVPFPLPEAAVIE